MNLKLPYNLLKDLIIFTLTGASRLATYPYLFQKASYRINQRGLMKLTKQAVTTYLIIFFAFSSVAGLFLFNPFGTKEAEAAWFNDNWAYRKEVPITANAAEDTDVFFSFTLDTATLITAGQLQSSCQDIRITDVNGNLLQYHVGRTNACNNAATTIDALAPYAPNTSTPTLIAGASTFYVYYGNPSVPSADKGTNFSQSEAASYTVGALGSAVKGPSPVSYWKFDEGWGVLLKNSGQAVQDTQTGLIGYWKLDENTGTTITDSSGLGKSGTFGAAAAAPSWTTGKYDSGVNFDDTDNIAISSPGLPTGDFTYSTWVNLNNAAGGVFIQAEDDSGSDTDEFHLEMTTTTFQVRMDGSTVFNVGIAISTGTWYHIAVTRSGSTVTAYLDNASIGSGTSASTLNFGDCELILGSDSTDDCPTGTFANQYDGKLDEVRVYNRSITDAQRTAIYNQGPEPTTVNTPTWQTENLCISAKCLYFDGTNNEYAVKFDEAALDFAAADNFTVGAWVKRNGAASANSIILQKSTANIGSTYTGYKMYMDASGDLCFAIQDGTNAVDSACTSAVDFDDDNWHFIEGVKAATTSVTLYVDGKQRAQDSSIASTGTLANSSSLGVGIDSDGTSNDWLGFIDEVKVYRDQTARTAAQATADYNARSNPEGVSQQQANNNQNMPAALSDGLVGYYKMDETSWTNDCSTTSVTDSSGNGKNGISCPNTTGPTGGTAGKFGNSGTFDGSNDYVEVASASDLTADHTMSAWVYPTTAFTDYGTIFDSQSSGGTQNDQYNLYIKSNGEFATYLNGECTATPTGALSLNSWQHIVSTYNHSSGQVNMYLNGTLVNSCTYTKSGSGTTILRIGARSSSTYPYDGRIDEARVYNKALSANQVSQLAKWAPGPAGWWKMDEGTGTTITDSSGYGSNSAAFTGAPTFGNGKYGKGLSFDGTNDLASITNTTAINVGKAEQSYTVMAWIRKPNTTATTFFTKDNGASPGPFELYTTGFNPSFRLANAGWTQSAQVTADSSIVDGRWYHVAAVRNETTNQVEIYFNGVLEATSSDGTAGTDISSSQPISVGAWSDLTNDLNGTVDDLRVYNYARTPGQIIEDMNAGHPPPGSPVGTPVGFWKFNEGADDTCSGGSNDVCNSGSGQGGANLDGTSTATRTNSGKLSRALDFDGTNDVVTITNNFGIDLNDNLSNFTFSSWIYPDSDGEADSGTVFNKGSNTYLRVDNQGTTDLDLECNLDRATTDTNVNVADALTTATWNHVACAWDGTTLSVFVNGQLRGSSTSGTGAISADANSLLIGGDTANNFDGKIDEFKVYNAALNASQIALDANAASTQVLGATGNNSTAGAVNAESQEYCIPGDSTTCTVPVARWDFEEGVASGGTNFDTSGNGNNCSTDGNIAVGKSGKARNYTESVRVSCGTGSTIADLAALTAEAWIYPRDMGEFSVGTVMTKNDSGGAGGWAFGFDNGTTNGFRFYADFTGTDLDVKTADNMITLNTWNHVAVTWTGGTAVADVHIYVNGKEVTYGTTTAGVGTRISDATNTLYIGETFGQNNGFDGIIDQARVFNYVRTQPQLAYDMNRGAPIAHWKMDECQGVTTNDSAGNNFSGTLNVSASGTTTAGTCSTASSAWGGSSGSNSGKRNYALYFDGSDDRVNIYTAGLASAFNTSAGTISGWAKVSGSGVWTDGSADYVISLRTADDGTSANAVEVYKTTSNNTFGMTYNAGGTNESFTYTTSTTDWIFFTITWDKPNDVVRHYINGQLIETDTALGTWSGSLNSNRMNIGSHRADITGNHWNGQIDDVRIHNYPLTESQVKNLYNQGAANYGPVTGAP